MYHYYTCPELRKSIAAVRRVPYNCRECDETIRLPWNHELKNHKDQPRFQIVEDCFFQNILGDMNNWYIIEIQQDKFTVKENYEAGKYDSLQHIIAVIHGNIEVGKIGAMPPSDTPYTDQDTGELKCEYKWLCPVPKPPF